jgi:FkbM family methyltransferase
MMRAAYKLLLKMTRIRGLNRLDRPLRGLLRPPVDGVNGLRMELDLYEDSQLDLLAGQVAEARTLSLMRRLLAPGDTCIDVGAHVGLHTLVAATTVGPQGRVIAIDPQPYCCERILTNIALNGLANVLVVAAAAGDRDGVVVLHTQTRADRTRLSLSGDGQADLPQQFEARLTRIDSLMEGRRMPAIKLMKIDVEGYEWEVLAGATETLAITRNLIFECLPESSVEKARQTAEALIARGFELKQVDGTPWTPSQTAIENNVWATKD